MTDSTSVRTGPLQIGKRSESFTRTHPRLPSEREARIRDAGAGADPSGGFLPACMPGALPAGVDVLLAGR